MARLTTRKQDSLESDTLEALSPVLERGPLADVWLQFAASEPALRAYLSMEHALQNGALELREIEAIKLRVSTLNKCAFCVATHRVKARAAGLDSDAITAIREGQAVADQRLNAMLAIVNVLLESPGTVPDALINQARDAGVGDAALMDIAMAMSAIFFTNVANHINDTGS